MSQSFQDTSRKSKPAVFGDTFIFSNSFDGYISPTLLDEYNGSPPPDTESTEKENIPMNISDSGNKDIITISTNTPFSNTIQQPFPKSKIQKFSSDETIRMPYVPSDQKDVISFFLTDSARQKVKEEENMVKRNDLPTETVGEFTPGSSTIECDDILRSNKDILSFSTTPTEDQVPSKSIQPPRIANSPSHAKASLKKPYVSLNFSDIIAFFNSEESLLEACENDSVAKENNVPNDADQSGQEDSDVATNDTNNPDCFMFFNSRSKSHVPDPVDYSTPLKRHPDIRRESQSQRRTSLVLQRGSILSFFSDEEYFDLASRLGIESDTEAEDRGQTGSEDERGEAADNVDEFDPENNDIKVFQNYKGARYNKDTIADLDELSDEESFSSSPVLVVTPEFPDIISFYNPDRDQSASYRRKQRLAVPNGEFPVPEFSDSDESENDLDASIEEVSRISVDRSEFPLPISSDFDDNMNDKELEIKMERPRRLPTLDATESSSVELSSTKDGLELPIPELDLSHVNNDKQLGIKKKTPRKLPTVDLVESSLEPFMSDDDPEFPEPPDSPECLLDTIETCDKDLEPYPPPFIEEVDIPIDAYLNVYAFANEENFIHVGTADDIHSDDEDSIPGLEEFIEISKDDKFTGSVVVEDSCSDDGTPIRDVQDIEDLPDIEQAIDMVAAIDDFEMLELEECAPDPLGEELYGYGNEELEKDLTEEIDSLLSEAEHLIAPSDSRQETYVDDDLDRFFEDVADPEEHLLKSDDNDVPQIFNISVIIPSHEYEKHSSNNPVDPSVSTGLQLGPSQELQPARQYLQVPDPCKDDNIENVDFDMPNLTASYVIGNRASSPAPTAAQRAPVFVADPLHYPVPELSGDQEPYSAGMTSFICVTFFSVYCFL